MAIIVEDGTIVANANSYVTTEEVEDYADARGIILANSIEQLITNSMDYIEGLDYIGFKYTDSQSLQWPRSYVCIDGYYKPINYIPKELKNGQMATIVAIDQNNSPLATIDRTVKREKVDVIEIEYADNASSTNIVRTINNALKKLLKNSGGGQFVVSKA